VVPEADSAGAIVPGAGSEQMLACSVVEADSAGAIVPGAGSGQTLACSVVEAGSATQDDSKEACHRATAWL
jgi:hypothetical protein